MRKFFSSGPPWSKALRPAAGFAWVKVLALSSLLCAGLLNDAYGQHKKPTNAWKNYGDGHDNPAGLGNTWTITGVEYTDEVRAKVIHYYYVSSSGTSGNNDWVHVRNVIVPGDRITSNATYPNPFAVNDRVLIVDLSKDDGSGGNQTRNYDIGTVKNLTYNSGANQTIIEVELGGAVQGAVYVPLSTIGNPKTFTQILKVPQWGDIDFDGSGGGTPMITCHPWELSTSGGSDAGTGGICAFVSNGTVDFTTYGEVNTVGKGVPGIAAVAGGLPGSPSGSAGTAGTAVKMDGTHGTGSVLGYHKMGNAGIGISGACYAPTGMTKGGDGGCGTHAIDGTGPFSTPYEKFLPASKQYLYMAPGNAGRPGTSGQGAGAGGNGGGGGAGGFFETVAALPQEPKPGTMGSGPSGIGNGAQGGTGGDGGGFIYFRANTIIGSDGARIVINADGEVGTSGFGKNPLVDKGGDGGNGGKGGDGSCVGGTYYAPGGGGARGTGGNGPDGGGGGFGGNAGSVWVGCITKTTFITSSPPPGKTIEIQADGGPGSSGGSGGPAGNNGTNGIDGAANPLCGAPLCGTCGPLTYINQHPGPDVPYYHSELYYSCNITYLCNCSTAFDILSNMTVNTPMGPGMYKFTEPMVGDPANYATFEENPTATGGTLFAYKWTTQGPAGTCSAPGTATLQRFQCPLTYGATPPNNFWPNIAPPTGTLAGNVYNWPAGSYNVGANLLTDNIGGSATSSCGGGGPGPGEGEEEEDCPRPCDGKDGEPGDPGQAGEVDVPAAPEPDLGSDDPWSPPIVGIDDNAELYALKLIPNPATDYVTLNFQAKESGSYEIRATDLSGKEVYATVFNATSGENNYKLDVRSFAQGNYIITLKHGNMQQRVQFIKNDR